MSHEANVSIRWTLEVQKFKACPKHVQGGEPFDPNCKKCIITEPPVEATVHEPRRAM